MKLFRLILLSQAIYTIITAIWPLIDIESFMKVTGYKHDVWLVKTVGALLIPVSLCMISHLWIQTDKRPVLILGACTSISFISIDLYYALTDVISDIYLADAAIEFIFLSGWLYLAATHYKQLKQLS